MRRLVVACVLVVAACGGRQPPDKPRLHVATARSLKDPLGRYARGFTAAHVALDPAGSSHLTRLVRGAHPPDVVAAAGTAILEGLYAQGLVEKPTAFARTSIVLAIPPHDNTIQGIRDLVKPGVRIVTASPSTPGGALTRVVISRLPRPQRQAVRANLLTGRHDAADLKRHAADAAFVLLPEARADGVRKIDLGDRLKPYIRYEVAVVKGTRHPAAAHAFVAGLLTRDGRATLKRAGLKLP